MPPQLEGREERRAPSATALSTLLRSCPGGAGMTSGSLVVRIGWDLGPCLVPAASLPHRGEQTLRLGALGGLEAGEQVPVYPVHHLGDSLKHRDPLPGDLDEVSAAILGIAASDRVAPLLELVQDCD